MAANALNPEVHTVTTGYRHTGVMMAAIQKREKPQSVSLLNYCIVAVLYREWVNLVIRISTC
jgi:hypothetical protein